MKTKHENEKEKEKHKHETKKKHNYKRNVTKPNQIKIKHNMKIKK